MKICDIERKDATFGDLERGDVFEIKGEHFKGELFMKASVTFSDNGANGGVNLKNGELIPMDDFTTVKMVNAHLQLEG